MSSATSRPSSVSASTALDAAFTLLARLPAPLLALCALALLLLAAGLARRLRAAVLGAEAADSPYRHMRHRHRLNAAWRPARDDPVRRLLFFATGRRMTTDYLAPVLNSAAAALLLAALVPDAWAARALAGLRALKDDPLAGVALVGGSILLQDTLRNAVAGLELTTTHVRFDKHDRVRFHAAGVPEGVVRHVTSREVVLKTDAGEHVFIPAALAVSLAVTVLDDDSEDEDEKEGGAKAVGLAGQADVREEEAPRTADSINADKKGLRTRK